eukprot:8539323-Ditylum_brightwellii.AAC.1
MKELAKESKELEKGVKDADHTKTISDRKLLRLKESIELKKTISNLRDSKHQDKKMALSVRC